MPDERWPVPRGFHVANCLVDPESDEAKDDQSVIIFWGQGVDAKHVPDIWIFHVQSKTWKEVGLNPRNLGIEDGSQNHIFTNTKCEDMNEDGSQSGISGFVVHYTRTYVHACTYTTSNFWY